MAIIRLSPALGKDGLPAELRLGGAVFRLSTVFKHTYMSAVALFEAGDGDRVVLKCYRTDPFFGVPVAWLWALVARYEAAVLAHVQGVPGMPRLRERYGRTGLVRDYVPGRPLTKELGVGDAFFEELIRLLGRIHDRGVAYVDLEKPSNVIVGDDGRPHLVDFQAAFYWPERLLGQTAPVRWLRDGFQRADFYHARKHHRKLGQRRMDREEADRLRRKPLVVRMANAVYRPLKQARRLLMGRD